ncbi:hypothetical protein [Hoeflea sp.]|uniref:hypothetical protein n=1 Tax=Hoeflea sp. TaxID=1940281 RepID=UPI003B01281B
MTFTNVPEFVRSHSLKPVRPTWKKNYERSSEDAGVDLVRYPDKALDPVIGARILIRGLLDGRWNGKGFGIQHYLTEVGQDDLRNARRTVNITDRWDLIAGYYHSFLKAIEEAGGVPKLSLDSNRVPEPKSAEDETPQTGIKNPEKSEPASPTSGGVLAALFQLLAGFFKKGN